MGGEGVRLRTRPLRRRRGGADRFARALAAARQRAARRDAGRRAACLAPLRDRDVLYFGGPRLLATASATVLATYPDRTPAIVRSQFGRGKIILMGPHVERPAPSDGGDDIAALAGAGAMLRSLLGLSR